MNISPQKKSINRPSAYSYDEISVFKEVPDASENDLIHEINSTLGINSISQIKMVKLYRIEGLNSAELSLINQLLCNSVYEKSYINNNLSLSLPSPSQTKFTKPEDWDKPRKIIEVAYKPGVMDPEVNSVICAAKDLGITIKALTISNQYHFFGSPTEQEIEIIIDSLLVNKTVQYFVTTPPKTLSSESKTKPVFTIPLLNMNAKELLQLSQDRQLHLNQEEMILIHRHFKSLGRNPRDAELETIAQTWSEHCYHKTFKAKLIIDGKEKAPLYKRLKKTARKFNKNVLSAFVDNAGAYRFYDDYAILGKVETHNSPSAIEPYGGAGTGSGGVFRDIMGTGKGAKVIASTDMFCFAPPDLNKDELPSGCLHPRYLLRRVVAGVRDYGNRMGIPTNNGSVHFHKNFRAKPTVIVGAYGITPEKYCYKKEPKPDDLIFTVGGKTGRDGIHGATFSSGQMTAQTKTVNASAVQIGNPIEEKRMSDALLAARDEGLIETITDCGAGGFSSAIGEMGSQIGAYVDLAKAPLKYSGLTPWEIWVSESQERMICAISPENARRFQELCADYNVEATKIGHFTSIGQLTVVYNDQLVCDLSMEFLHNGLPQRIMHGDKQKTEILPKKKTIAPSDWEKLYCNVLGHLNVCSKEPIVRQYDHGVQGTNVLPPFGGENNNAPNDAVILRPLPSKPYGLIISHGMNPQLNMIDPYKGSIWAITEALANLVAVGGNPEEVALIDNFIWPFPDKQSLWDLDAALDACIDAMNAFELPFISGKDSLSSTYRYKDGSVLKIPPVLCISAFGKIKDITKTISADFKKIDSIIALVGNLDITAMGGSCYSDIVGSTDNKVPTICMQTAKTTFKKLHTLITQQVIDACHDISEGGIAVALAEMCFGGNVGATIDLSALSDNSMYAFFNETAGCFLIELDKKNEKKLKEIEIPYTILGRTTKNNKITVSNKNKPVGDIEISLLLEAWQQPLRRVFR